MRTSFHHQPEAQRPNFPLSTSWQADYPIFREKRKSASGDHPTVGTGAQQNVGTPLAPAPEEKFQSSTFRSDPRASRRDIICKAYVRDTILRVFL